MKDTMKRMIAITNTIHAMSIAVPAMPPKPNTWRKLNFACTGEAKLHLVSPQLWLSHLPNIPRLKPWVWRKMKSRIHPSFMVKATGFQMNS